MAVIKSGLTEKQKIPKRLSRCGLCKPCLIQTDCGVCNSCIHRKTGKQVCKLRKCVLIAEIQRSRQYCYQKNRKLQVLDFYLFVFNSKTM